MFDIDQVLDGQDLGLLLFIGPKNDVNITELIDVLNENSIRFMGGIFPGLISNKQVYYDKIILKKSNFEGDPVIIDEMENLSKYESSFDFLKDNNYSTAITIVDGHNQFISKYLVDLYNIIGNKYSIIGTGAGKEIFDDIDVVLTKNGLLKKGAAIVFMKDKCNIAVKHGWDEVFGPFIATKTKDNKVIEINWTPAASLYIDLLEKQCNVKITSENFFNYSKDFPFGIYKENHEQIVKDVMKFEDNTLFLLGDIKENAVFHILTGKKNKMIKAAREACMEVVDNKEDNKVPQISDVPRT